MPTRKNETSTKLTYYYIIRHINSDRYFKDILVPFSKQLTALEKQKTLFRQDGVIAHTARATMKCTFGSLLLKHPPCLKTRSKHTAFVTNLQYLLIVLNKLVTG